MTDTCLAVIELLAESPDGIQKAWRQRVKPEHRSAAGKTIRDYLMSFSKVGITRDGRHYLVLRTITRKQLPMDRAIDLHRFFFEPSKSPSDFYYQE